jgi:outer membrane receptor protein involved in Fe transport
LLAEDAASIPFGTVSPHEAFDPFAVLLSYRNFGDVSFSGIDVGITCYIDADWTLSGNYSYVSDNLFPRSESQANNIYLNIPQHKGAIGLRFARENVPIHSEIRGRYVGGFPFRAGVYSGDIESYLLVDVNVGYTFSNTFRAILSIDNVLNNKHVEMIGAPKIGRFAVLRLTKSF